MRVAIVGCGQISRAHIKALQELEGIEIVAVCDQDRDRARDAASQTASATVYTNLATLLDQARPDAVHVLTPPASHAAVAIQAMEAGCHVLVEKPMALTLEEADRMIATARLHHVKLCTNHNYLFKPSVSKARRLVASGVIGDVVYVDSYYGLSGEGSSYGGTAGGSHWAWRLPGGIFTNFLPHLVYLQLAFLQQIESVAGVAVAGKPGEPGSEMSILLQGASATGTMTMSTRTKPYAKFVDIYGTKGIVHADLVREVCTVHKDVRLPRMLSKALFSMEASSQLAFGTAANTAKVALGTMKNMPELPVLFREFYDGIKTGHMPAIQGEDGRKMIEVMEEVWAKAPHEPPPSTAPTIEFVTGPRTEAEQAFKRANTFGKVLVTGAAGFLGQQLVGALTRCGAEVVALVRDKGRAPLVLERQAEIVAGDIRDPKSIEAAMQGVDLVYHCAAVTTNSVPWSVHETTNVQGSKVIFEAAVHAHVQRVVHVSSVVVYGLNQQENGPIQESARYAGNVDQYAYYLRSKLEADKLAFEFRDKHHLPVTVLRLGILYGEDGRQAIGRGLAQFGPVRLMLGNGSNALPFVHVNNAVDCLLLAAITPEALGQAYNVVDEPQLTVRDVISRSTALTGEKLVLLPVPSAWLSGMAGLLELKHRRANADVPPKLSRYVVRSASRDIRYDTTKARRELGWRSAVALDEGLRVILGGNSSR